MAVKTKKTKLSKNNSASDASKNISCDIDFKIMQLELELSKISREKSAVLLNKATYLYLLFIILAVLGMFNGFTYFFNILVVMSIFILIGGVFPYIMTTFKEEERIKELLKDMKEKYDGKK